MAKTAFQKVLIGGAAVLASVVAVAVYLVATFDPNAYKGLATDWMKTHRDRTLQIDGPIELDVFPRLKVKATQVTLSERGRADEFAHIESMALSVGVWPLFQRRLEVDQVAAEGVRLNYERDANGRSNIDDLISPSDTPADPAQANTGESLRFDISTVQLSRVQLKLQDASIPVKGTVALNSLKTGRLSDGVESPVELDAELDLTEPAVKGRLSGKTQLTLGLSEGRFGLRGSALNWTGDALTLRSIDAALSGDLSYQTKLGTVSAKALKLALGLQMGDTVLKDSQVEVEAFNFDPSQNQLALERLALRLRGTQAGAPMSLALNWPQLKLQGNSLQGSALDGEFSLKGTTALEGQFKSGAPQGNFTKLDVPGLTLSLSGKQGAQAIAGEVRSNLSMKPQALEASLEALQAQLTLQEPSLQPLKLQASGQAKASASSAQWTLKGELNGNPFDTQGRLGLQQSPLHIDASANFASLDLNRLLPTSKAAPQAKGGAADAAPAPIDLSFLRSFQGELRFKANQFAYGKYRAAPVAVTAKLQNGSLRAAPLNLGIWGGSVQASLTARAADSGGVFGLQLNAQGVDMHQVLRDVADKDLLEGKAQLNGELSAQGKTVDALVASLNGKLQLRMQDGAIKGVNLAQQFRQAKGILNAPTDMNSRSVTTEKTDFSELSATFNVASGIASNNDLSAKSPFLRLGGQGAIDLPKATLDYTVRATVAETSKGQGGADLAELRGLTIPVRLTGPLDGFTWNIRWSEVAADLLKSKAGKQLETQLKDKLAERLGVPASPASAPEGAPVDKREAQRQLLERGLRQLIK